MLKIIFKYILGVLVVFSALILIIDYIVLPGIANRNKEIYLPNVSGINLEDAKLLLKDFNLKI